MNEIQPGDEARQITRELGERLDRGREVAAGTRGAAGVRALELWRDRALVQQAQENSWATEDPAAARGVHGIHLVEIDAELMELLDFGVPPRGAQAVGLAMSAAALLRHLITYQGVESRSANEWLTRFAGWQATHGDELPPAAPRTGADEADGR